MINKKSALVIITLLISCFLFYYLIKVNSNITKYHTEVFKVNEGYGYSIYLNDQQLIRQTHIPAISNKNPFCSYNDAFNTSNIIKSKLEARLNPTITIEELKQIGVAFNCDTLP